MGAIGAGLSLGGIALGTVSFWESQTQQTSMKQLAGVMADTMKTENFFEQGAQVLGKREDAVQRFLHHKIEHVWRLIETFPCNTDASVGYALQEIAFQRYGEHLRRHTQTAITGAIESRITPEIFNAKALKRLLQGAGIAETSVLAHEPGQIYKFGRLIPLLMDLETLTFGFGLKVPTGIWADVRPVFTVFNVDFPQEGDPNFYRAPLPESFIVDKRTNLVALRKETC